MLTAKISRAFGLLREGSGDPSAAQDIIADLSDIVQTYEEMSEQELGRELSSWFESNLDAIKDALGISEEVQFGDDLDEGGPGSGPHPAGADELPPGDDMGGGESVMDGDADDEVLSDVMRRLRDIVDQFGPMIDGAPPVDPGDFEPDGDEEPKAKKKDTKKSNESLSRRKR